VLAKETFTVLPTGAASDVVYLRIQGRLITFRWLSALREQSNNAFWYLFSSHHFAFRFTKACPIRVNKACSTIRTLKIAHIFNRYFAFLNVKKNSIKQLFLRSNYSGSVFLFVHFDVFSQSKHALLNMR